MLAAVLCPRHIGTTGTVHLRDATRSTCGVMPGVSAVQRAKRAFVVVLRALATTYGLRVTVNRDSPDASITCAFRKVALRVHPDKGGSLVHSQELLEARDAWQQAITQEQHHHQQQGAAAGNSLWARKSKGECQGQGRRLLEGPHAACHPACTGCGPAAGPCRAPHPRGGRASHVPGLPRSSLVTVA